MSDPKIIVALDFPKAAAATRLVKQLDPSLCRLKVGKELFVRSGPKFIESVQKKGFDVFLDLKFHDIPNTVAGACRAAADLGVWMVNVHAIGGHKMMEAAREAIAGYDSRPLLIAVTVLTSMDAYDLEAVGIEASPAETVERLAALAKTSGLDGVVCSALEVELLRESFDDDFLLVTPGIRPSDAQLDDQKRVMTPKNAIAAGANYLVIGRPITQAKDPPAVLEQIVSDLKA